MEPAELRVVQIARQVSAVAMQASKAYNEAQASLDLSLVLTSQRLKTYEGTQSSIESLQRLSELTTAHEEMFKKLVALAVGQLTAAVGELPPERAAEYRDGMASALNRSLSAQGEFYRDRAEWIAAALGLCELVKTHRETITFAEDGLFFNEEDSRTAFRQLATTINRIHEREVANARERLGRLAESMAILNAAAKS